VTSVKSPLSDEKTGAAAPISLIRLVAASFIGTTIESYDFFLYGTAAALVFNQLFFPTLDPLLGTMVSFGSTRSAFSRAQWARSCSGM